MSISHHVNREETSMSSTTSEQSKSGTSGKGIYIALIPWIAFTVLVEHSSLKLGSLAALAIAVIIAVPGVRKGQPKVLEVGAVVTFLGFVAVAFLADASTAQWVARYARGIAAAILSLIAFTSLLFVPFTEQYAREQVPQQYWSSPRFKQINRKLTTLWACVFAAMVPFHVLAGAINTTRGNLIFNWAIPLALVLWAVKQSSAAGDDEAPAGSLA